MEYSTISTNGNVSVVQNNKREFAVIDNNGNEVVPFGKYKWIDRFDSGLCRVHSN